MIVPSEIIENDIIKALVNEDDLEEEMYGVVAMNTGNVLGVHYLSQTEKIYKSACVFEIDSGDMNPVPYESITEHHPCGTTFQDLDMKQIGQNMFVYYCDIDIEDDDSEIYEDCSDSETDSEMDDFIVPDVEIETMGLPIGHEMVDKEWEKWKPSTPGARSFKDTVDMIEMHAKRMADEMSF